MSPFTQKIELWPSCHQVILQKDGSLTVIVSLCNGDQGLGNVGYKNLTINRDHCIVTSSAEKFDAPGEIHDLAAKLSATLDEFIEKLAQSGVFNL